MMSLLSLPYNLLGPVEVFRSDKNETGSEQLDPGSTPVSESRQTEVKGTDTLSFLLAEFVQFSDSVTNRGHS